MFAEYIGGADIFGCKMEIKMKIDYLRKAKWIFANTAKRQIVDSYFCYEKKFFSAASDAFLYISAHSDYAVFINNVFLDCGQFQDYEGYPAVDCLDLSCKLKIGENELKILHYVQGTDFSTSSKGIPGVIFAVVSGDDILCLSDESCLVYQDVRFEGNAEIITTQLGYNFDYNAMIPVQGKRPAVILKGKSNNFIERPVKKLLISALKSGVNIKFGYYKSPAAITSVIYGNLYRGIFKILWYYFGIGKIHGLAYFSIPVRYPYTFIFCSANINRAVVGNIKASCSLKRNFLSILGGQ